MQKVIIDYTNWRGDRAERTIIPISIRFGSSQWHPDEQWLLLAIDDKLGEQREFAMENIHKWTALLE